ncbi:adenylate/guanylate cyclase domain-containing protein [Prosthecobacter sp.]|uniref:adenylate/guanylate cyclase domain-containing protein n=1 Tax=Prosthecobacter sp. TaxID=1965333 RepID=UPI002ABAE6AF|nr:adenylate/guanylate cyclase domain-containing protein [Prosthecobacter sp.]MDZ4404773.1 adenylate/guanylate cyclase domain-containing protein [Prosthecobacter sp.]
MLHALNEARVSNARLINVLRLATISVLLLIHTLVPQYTADVTGERVQTGVVIATGLAFLLWRIGRHSDKAARRTALAVPLLDMPTAFLIQWLSMSGVQGDRAVANWTLAAFVCLLMMSALSLGRVVLFGSWLLATVLSVSLQWHAQESPLGMTGGVVLLALAMIVCHSQQRIRIQMVERLSVEQEQRERLGRYFSPEVARQITESEAGLAAGQDRLLTVLFTDLRSFTSMAERLEASQIVPLLNAYFEEMVAVVFKHGGTLDKYLGDGLMIYFGAPLPQPDHAARAVRCAMEMLERLDALNHAHGLVGRPALRMGIGIHTGMAVVGTMGASHRQDYTAIGSTVNLASRLEQLTKDYEFDIIVSEETRKAAGDAVRLRDAGMASVKGVAEPLKIFTPEC